jgi:hypothetical protein
MTSTIEITDIKYAERIARSWVRMDFPYREWNTISESEADMWIRDVSLVLEAINEAGLTVVEKDDCR